MVFRLIRVCIAALVCGSAVLVHAQGLRSGGAVSSAENPDASNSVTFRGFATLGLARGSSAEFGTVSSYTQKTPVFDRWSADLDSVIGGQVNWRLDDQDSLVAQVVARANEEWGPRPTLAFWQHAFMPQLTLRAGRLPSPLFRDSDIINVGYANLTVRPALPVYLKVNAMQSLDGADLSWQFDWNDVAFGVQAFAGDTGYTHRVHPDGYEDISVNGPRLHGLAFTARSGSVSMRVSRTRMPRYALRSADISNFNVGLGAMASNLRAMGLSAQADALQSYENPIDLSPIYSSIGIDWSPRDWRIIGEWTAFQSNSEVVGTGESWQLTVSRSFDHWSPYVFFSEQKMSPKSANAAAFASTGIPSVDAGLGQIRTGLDYFMQTADISMRSVGLGIRYDLTENLALKVQWEGMSSNFAIPAGSRGAVVTNPPAHQVFSVVLDMMF